MLRLEAIELQTKIENEAAKYLGYNEGEVIVQLTLSNKLKFSIANNLEYLFDKEKFRLDYIGANSKCYICISEFYKCKNFLETFLIQNRYDIELLLWSYDHQNELIG